MSICIKSPYVTLFTSAADGAVIEREVRFPFIFEICGCCSGHGKSSAYLGAITSDEWHRDWSHDEQEDYVAGRYDRPCDACDGSGKVMVVDEDRCVEGELAVALADLVSQRAEEADDRAIMLAEIARGA